MSEAAAVEENVDGEMKVWPIPQPTLSAMLGACAMVRELIGFAQDGVAVNDWQIRQMLHDFGLYHDVVATEEHVQSGAASEVGKTISLPTAEFYQVLANFAAPDAAEPEAETAEAAE